MMSTSDRQSAATTFADRVWPVIDVYGRVRRVLGDERAVAADVSSARFATA